MEEFKLQDSLRQKVIGVHGKQCLPWLSRLPRILQKYAAEWQINILNPVANLSYNIVMHAEDKTGNYKLIFKAVFPGPDFDAEIRALEYYAGNGCVQLLNYSLEDGVMLLEEALPGTMLAEYTRKGRDEDAVVICADIITSLHSKQFPMSKPTQYLHDYYSEFRHIVSTLPTACAPFEIPVVTRALDEYASLLASTKKTVLLHADLHHFNILRATREDWLAIDPKGVLGDPVFEVTAFMRNPYPGLLELTNPKHILHNRIEAFSEYLRFDKRRVWGWSFAQTVLTALWVLEDHNTGSAECEQWYAVAKLLLELEPR